MAWKEKPLFENDYGQMIGVASKKVGTASNLFAVNSSVSFSVCQGYSAGLLDL